MLKKIVVPLDGSPLAERALPVATRLARQDGAPIVLLRVPVSQHVYLQAADGYGMHYPEKYFGEAYREAGDYLKAIRDQHRRDDFDVAATVVEGDTAGAIVDAARQPEAGFIVMSSHGYSGLSRWILGSVAERVLRDANCPVLVVRSADPIRRMLITLDGSDLSQRVLPPALDVAQALGATVTLLRVVPELLSIDVDELDQYEGGLGQRLAEERQEQAETYLASLAERLTRAGLSVDWAVRSGAAAEAILSLAEQQAVDLVAMATHGRSGLRRWIYGSVTEKVLHMARCSMLVVRPADHELH